MTQNDIPKRPFGNTGPEVTQVGLGGEGVLRTQRRDEAAAEVRSALDTPGHDAERLKRANRELDEATEALAALVVEAAFE